MLITRLYGYLHYLWILLAAIIVFKAILSFIFNEQLEGFHGFLISIFKWYGEQDQEMAEQSYKKILMRFVNVLTFFIYVILGIIILMYIIPLFFTPS